MALRDQPYIPLYVQDILTDEKLSCCSLSTIGVYLKIMCVLHKSETYGGILYKQIPKQNFSAQQYFVWVLTKQTGIETQEISDALEELIFFKVMQIDDNYQGTGVHFLYQKRMVKDFETSVKRALSAKKGGGNPSLRSKKSTNGLYKQNPKQTDKQNTEYEYENESVKEKGLKGKNQKSFVPPTLDEFTSYFVENGYDEILAARAWRGYDAAGWKDSHGNKIKSWKQKCQHVWFKETNKPISNNTGTESKFDKLKKAHDGVINPY